VEGTVVGEVGGEGELDDWGLAEDEDIGPEPSKGAADAFASILSNLRLITPERPRKPSDEVDRRAVPDAVEPRSPIGGRLNPPGRTFETTR
jgi:hypothetical protein